MTTTLRKKGSVKKSSNAKFKKRKIRYNVSSSGIKLDLVSLIEDEAITEQLASIERADEHKE